jgi:hypothetical protein
MTNNNKAGRAIKQKEKECSKSWRGIAKHGEEQQSTRKSNNETWRGTT